MLFIQEDCQPQASLCYTEEEFPEYQTKAIKWPDTLSLYSPPPKLPSDFDVKLWQISCKFADYYWPAEMAFSSELLLDSQTVVPNHCQLHSIVEHSCNQFRWQKKISGKKIFHCYQSEFLITKPRDLIIFYIRKRILILHNSTYNTPW